MPRRFHPSASEGAGDPAGAPGSEASISYARASKQWFTIVGSS
jgi:hypothetical protein